MAERRIIYLAVLVACLVFYWAYQEWLGYLMLMGILWLPWFSLLISLPSMLLCRVEFRCPGVVMAGQQVEISYAAVCKYPVAALKGKVKITRELTGEAWKQQGGSALRTEHCGAQRIAFHRLWIYDYLGLFRLPVRHKQEVTVFVRPLEVAVENPPGTARYLANAWKAKSGGGFAENHELRLYRPGDSLRQIHWKLSAKTGKLIFREPMEAVRGAALLTVELVGTPEQLDRKLGKLCWISRYLLEREIPHRIQCLTGRGMEQFSVETLEHLYGAIDSLLASPPAAGNTAPVYMPSSWCYHIGGDGDES